MTACCSAPTWSRTSAGWSRAYDDAAGVTAQFNRNVLAVVNRELDADFDVDAFRHVAVWNSDEERMEMSLQVDEAQKVYIRRWTWPSNSPPVNSC